MSIMQGNSVSLECSVLKSLVLYYVILNYPVFLFSVFVPVLWLAEVLMLCSKL
jgi:hypothetical protein